MTSVNALTVKAKIDASPIQITWAIPPNRLQVPFCNN